jgi:hypothetical protein
MGFAPSKLAHAVLTASLFCGECSLTTRQVFFKQPICRMYTPSVGFVINAAVPGKSHLGDIGGRFTHADTGPVD